MATKRWKSFFGCAPIQMAEYLSESLFDVDSDFWHACIESERIARVWQNKFYNGKQQIFHKYENKGRASLKFDGENVSGMACHQSTYTKI